MSRVTDARKLITDERKELMAKIAKLEERLGGLDDALAALNGTPEPVKPAVQPKQRELTKEGRPRKRAYPENRMSKADRRKVIEAWLQAHPDDKISAHDMAKAINAPGASVDTIVYDMIRDRTVDQVDETKRGKPIIRHRPVKVFPVPGEGIQAERLTGTQVA